MNVPLLSLPSLDVATGINPWQIIGAAVVVLVVIVVVLGLRYLRTPEDVAEAGDPPDGPDEPDEPYDDDPGGGVLNERNTRVFERVGPPLQSEAQLLGQPSLAGAGSLSAAAGPWQGRAVPRTSAEQFAWHPNPVYPGLAELAGGFYDPGADVSAARATAFQPPGRHAAEPEPEPEPYPPGDAGADFPPHTEPRTAPTLLPIEAEARAATGDPAAVTDDQPRPTEPVFVPAAAPAPVVPEPAPYKTVVTDVVVTSVMPKIEPITEETTAQWAQRMQNDGVMWLMRTMAIYAPRQHGWADGPSGRRAIGKELRVLTTGRR